MDGALCQPDSKLASQSENPLDIPVHDSPKTPKTPFSPIVLPSSSLRTAVSTGGRWTKHNFRSEPLYSPPSIEVAKRFLRSVGGKNSVPPNPTDTPVTSRPDSSKMSRLAQCHGCHGMLGGGLHVGSAIGKNVCIFPHSELCRGGIPESDGWRGCPQDFVAQALSPSTHNPGLANHDAQLDFSTDQQGQEFGTPANFSSQYARNLAEKNVAAITNGLDLLRFQKQANGEGARGKVIQERRPGRVWFGDNMLPGVVEADVADHRAQNQQAAHLAKMDGAQNNLNISDIRKIPGMKEAVEFHLAGIRSQTPCLASAPSAPAPGLISSTPAAARDNVFFPTNSGVGANDGIRVSAMDPALGAGHGLGLSGLDHSDLIAQQLSDARTKYADMIRRKKLADQQLLAQQQQAQAAATAAHAKSLDEILQYQRKTQEAEAQLVATQQAYQQLRGRRLTLPILRLRISADL